MARRSTSAARKATVADAAQRMIGTRLRLVLKRLHKAAHAPPTDAEPIHQLRVATRRARAALEFFGSALPPKRRDWFWRKLRKLRKAADEARNLDVFRQRIEEEVLPAPAKAIRLITKQRARAQKPIKRLDKKLRIGHQWQTKLDELIGGLSSERHSDVQQQSFEAFVPQALEPVISRFTTALRSPDRSVDRLHKLRVAGKQLRYALELLEKALPKRLRTSLLAQLKQLQDELGTLNDRATAEQVISDLSALASGETKRWLKALRKQEREAFSEGRAKFLRSWTKKERQKWHSALERWSPHGGPEPKPAS